MNKAKAIVLIIVLMWLLATGANYAGALELAPHWQVGLKAVAHISTVVMWLLALYGLWLWLHPYVKKLVGTSAADSTIDEAPAITGTVKNLAHVLAEMEQDSSKASLLLLDAQTYAQTLVDLIQAIALKAESMAAESDQLQQALNAISAADGQAIARAAGCVADQHIRTLLLGKVTDSGYWNDVAMLISTQLGTLQQWEKGYHTFASQLMSEVAKAKAQLASSQAALELVGASRPLLQIQDKLNNAAGLLQIQRKPGLQRAAQSLPPIHAGLLKGGK